MKIRPTTTEDMIAHASALVRVYEKLRDAGARGHEAGTKGLVGRPFSFSVAEPPEVYIGTIAGIAESSLGIKIFVQGCSLEHLVPSEREPGKWYGYLDRKSGTGRTGILEVHE